jgi:hypothetical protein
MESRQHAVATASNTAAGTHGPASPAGKRDIVSLIQFHISLPKLRAGANHVRSTFARKIRLREQAQIQKRPIRIVSEDS